MCLLIKEQVNADGHGCNLEDTTRTFIVDGQGRRCIWARRHIHSRCNLDIVRANCPATCDVPCLGESNDRSHSPEPTNRPSSNSAMMSTNILIPCEDETDLEGTVFKIDGVELSCMWAHESDERCIFDSVRSNCPLTCNIPCIDTVSTVTATVDEGEPDTSMDTDIDTDTNTNTGNTPAIRGIGGNSDGNSDSDSQTQSKTSDQEDDTERNIPTTTFVALFTFLLCACWVIALY